MPAASVPAGELISSVTVGLDITHTADADLLIQLIAPDGTTITLANGVGDAGQNFTSTVFDDTAAMSIDDAAAPFTGTFRPEQPLSTLLAKDPSGTWTLQVTDQITGNTGTINAFSLTINTGPATWRCAPEI